MDNTELALKIPLAALEDEFICPICFNAMQQTTVTPCGHNFCNKCILECLNRKHQCPLCNHKPLVAKDLMRHHHYDKLIALLQQEKEKASKKYFDKLIGGRANNNSQTRDTLTNSQNEDISNFSPIEQIFHKHMRKSLQQYEEYYTNLKAKFDKSQQELKENAISTMQQMTAEFEKNIREKKEKQSQSEHDKQIAAVKAKFDSRIAEMEKSFQQSTDLLIAAYDKYMDDFIPKPAYLPVTISIVLEAKNIKIDNVRLSTTDSLRDAKLLFLQRMKETDNEVHTLPDDSLFIIRSPFNSEKEKNEEIIITDADMPIVQYNVEQASELVIRGAVVLESDKPKHCMTADFHKGDVVDYFTCKDCKFNWICKTCALNCHKGHQVEVYIKQHEPTWACCYCVKRKKCKIINAKNKQKKK